eukprot:TRINITY_DN38734_c0_g1_i1.p1 TRINITY_DN38734_c0_g1~~TRINITY_DN38734_c0_g1_i1.p1  ORF type:complete len:305 (+),score=47.95 TRINITY_DN38734_c0_g1_i1:81-995(+)
MASRGAICTGVEIVAAVALLCHQGVLRPCSRRVPSPVSILARRIGSRLWPLPPRSSLRSLLLVGLLGSAALVGCGLATAFLQPALPELKYWREQLRGFFLVMVMPGLVEEVVFRAVLLPTPAELLERTLPALEASTPRAGEADPFDVESPCPGAGPGACADGVAPELPKAALVDASVGIKFHLGVATDIDASCAAHTPQPLEVLPAQPQKSCDCFAIACTKGSRVRRPPLLEQVAALGIFLVYHLDAIHNNAVFADPRFLALAAILGLACQEAMLRSGSVWPGVFLHGFWVWTWLTFTDLKPFA